MGVSLGAGRGAAGEGDGEGDGGSANGPDTAGAGTALTAAAGAGVAATTGAVAAGRAAGGGLAAMAGAGVAGATLAGMAGTAAPEDAGEVPGGVPGGAVELAATGWSGGAAVPAAPCGPTRVAALLASVGASAAGLSALPSVGSMPGLNASQPAAATTRAAPTSSQRVAALGACGERGGRSGTEPSGAARGEPHWLQNLAWAGMEVPQTGQFIGSASDGAIARNLTLGFSAWRRPFVSENGAIACPTATKCDKHRVFVDVSGVQRLQRLQRALVVHGAVAQRRHRGCRFSPLKGPCSTGPGAGERRNPLQQLLRPGLRAWRSRTGCAAPAGRCWRARPGARQNRPTARRRC